MTKPRGGIHGNPRKEIGKDGEATRFKPGEQRARDAGAKGADKTNKTNAIRAHLRRLGKVQPQVDKDGKPIMTIKALTNALGGDAKGKKLNMAEIWAIIHAGQAAQNFKAMNALIENHDGKQVEAHLHKTTKSFAELVNAAAGNSPAPKDDNDGED